MQNIAMPKLKIKMLGFEKGEGIFGVGDRGLGGRRMKADTHKKFDQLIKCS